MGDGAPLCPGARGPGEVGQHGWMEGLEVRTWRLSWCLTPPRQKYCQKITRNVPQTKHEMIHFIYLGNFTGADLNVQMVAWVAVMMDLLCTGVPGENQYCSGFSC